MPERANRGDLGNLGYELFVMAPSCPSLVNLVLLLPLMPPDADQDQAFFLVDAVLTLIFLADFGNRSVRAESFRASFFRERAGSTCSAHCRCFASSGSSLPCASGSSCVGTALEGCSAG
jgi:hypothetical protein